MIFSLICASNVFKGTLFKKLSMGYIWQLSYHIFFRWNEVTVDKVGKWLCLDNTPLFFHNVTGFVHTCVTGYDELFQALAI
jgi:hypothetical protein